MTNELVILVNYADGTVETVDSILYEQSLDKKVMIVEVEKVGRFLHELADEIVSDIKEVFSD